MSFFIDYEPHSFLDTLLISDIEHKAVFEDSSDFSPEKTAPRTQFLYPRTLEK